MLYLSLDIEATGLKMSDLMIEFALLPFILTGKGNSCEIQFLPSFHRYVKCPSFDQLRPQLEPWVLEHNEALIQTAHREGVSLITLKSELGGFLEQLKTTFLKYSPPYTLLGKSMNAIDIPFLTRDLGEVFMRNYFSHRQVDVSAISYFMVDQGRLPDACRSGSELMKHFQMGDVCHNALDDARNVALMYHQLVKLT